MARGGLPSEGSRGTLFWGVHSAHRRDFVAPFVDTGRFLNAVLSLPFNIQYSWHEQKLSLFQALSQWGRSKKRARGERDLVEKVGPRPLFRLSPPTEKLSMPLFTYLTEPRVGLSLTTR